jgi:hypothetical protein
MVLHSQGGFVLAVRHRELGANGAVSAAASGRRRQTLHVLHLLGGLGGAAVEGAHYHGEGDGQGHGAHGRSNGHGHHHARGKGHRGHVADQGACNHINVTYVANS